MAENVSILLNDTTTEQSKKISSERRVGLWIGIGTFVFIVSFVCGYVIYKRVRRKIIMKNVQSASKMGKKSKKSKKGSISTTPKHLSNNVIPSNIKVEDLNSFKKKSNSKKKKKNKEVLGKNIENKEVGPSKSLSSNTSKSTYIFRDKKSINLKINENIDTITEMKNQLENIKKVKPFSNSARKNKSNVLLFNNEKNSKEDVEKSKKDFIDDNKNKKEVVRKVKDSKDIRSSSQSCENGKEVFYSCSSDVIGMPSSSSNLYPSLALSDKDIAKLNKINVDTNYSSFTISNNIKKHNINNDDSTLTHIGKGIVKKTNFKLDNITQEVIKKKDDNNKKRNKTNDNLNKNETKIVEETSYIVSEPEDIIEYDVSRNVMCKDKAIQSINLINNGNYINQSFINLSSDCTKSPVLEINRVKRSFTPSIKSIVPRISNIYIYPQNNDNESFIRKSQNNSRIKKQIVPSFLNYEVEKTTVKKRQERFEIVDETSKTEDDYKEEDYTK